MASNESTEKKSTVKEKIAKLNEKHPKQDFFDMMALVGLLVIAVALIYSMQFQGISPADLPNAVIGTMNPAAVARNNVAPVTPSNDSDATEIVLPEQIKEMYSFEELITEINGNNSLLGKEFTVQAYLNRSASCPKFVCPMKPCCPGCIESIYVGSKEDLIENLNENEFLFILGNFEESIAGCSGNKCRVECNPDLFVPEKEGIYEGMNAGKHKLKVKLMQYNGEECAACEYNSVTPKYFLELIEVIE